MNNFSLVNFVDLDIEKKLKVLSWRNHLNIRKWMFNSNKISQEEHLSFIKSLNGSKTRHYFLVKEDTEEVGVISFKVVDGEDFCVFGLYANPKKKGKGKILMEIMIDYAFNQLKKKKIIGEVLIDNIKMQKLCESFNFSKQGEGESYGKFFFIMELCNEDR